MGDGIRQRRTRSLSGTLTPPVGLGLAGQTLPAPGGSNQSALQRFGGGLPQLSVADLQAVLATSERPIRDWLDANESHVRDLSIRAATVELLRVLPEARNQGAVVVAGVVRQWAAERGITLPPLSIVPHPADTMPAAPPGPSLADSEIIAAVQSAVEVIGEGVRVDRRHGFAAITLSGATVGLRSGGAEVASEISWSGEMAVLTRVEDFHFQARLSAESWSLSLTFPNDAMPADLSRLGAIFREGESAVRSIIGEVQGFSHPNQISDLAERVKPFTDPVKKAVDAAKAAGGAGSGISFGLRAEGPAFGGGSGAAAPATIQGVLTIVF